MAMGKNDGHPLNLGGAKDVQTVFWNFFDQFDLMVPKTWRASPGRFSSSRFFVRNGERPAPMESCTRFWYWAQPAPVFFGVKSATNWQVDRDGMRPNFGADSGKWCCKPWVCWYNTVFFYLNPNGTSSSWEMDHFLRTICWTLDLKDTFIFGANIVMVNLHALS